MVLWIFGNSSPQAHWQASPDGRGTSDILQTCLITLALCVYTCLHLNIPARGSSAWMKFRRKFVWMLLALLAPEIVVYLAWAQRQRAKILLATLCEAKNADRVRPWHVRLWRRIFSRASKAKTDDVELNRHNDPTGTANLGPGESYSMVHAFFFCMGGLAFDLSRDSLPLLPEEKDRTVPDFDRLMWILKHPEYKNIVPNLSVRDIEDKSKADSIVKALTCIQASWFCLQTIARFAQGLPITLLELNTFVHATCALLVYLLWWEKPLDVAEPFSVGTEHDDLARRLCRSMDYPFYFYQGWESSATRSPQTGRLLRDGDVFATSETVREPLRLHATLIQPSTFEAAPSTAPVSGRTNVVTEAVEARHSTDTSPPACQNSSVFRLKLGDRVPGIATFCTVAALSAEIDDLTLARLRYEYDVKETLEYRKGRLVNCVSDFRDLSSPSSVEKRRRWLDAYFGWGREVRAVASELFECDDDIALTISGLAYGGLHLLAWGVELRTQAESTMWLVSAVTILCYLPAVALLEGVLIFLWMMSAKIYYFASGPLRGPRQKGTDPFLPYYLHNRKEESGAIMVLHLFYIACRVFIIVEVFIALPYANSAVFQTPNWTLYFPHIS